MSEDEETLELFHDSVLCRLGRGGTVLDTIRGKIGIYSERKFAVACVYGRC